MINRIVVKGKLTSMYVKNTFRKLHQSGMTNSSSGF